MPVEEDKVAAEVDRLLQLLVRALQENHVSIRALERRLGTPIGSKSRILRGNTKPTLRHLLEMVDALGLSWGDFFRAAYPAPGEAVSLKVGEPTPRRRAITLEEVPEDLAEQFEEWMKERLQTGLGLAAKR